MTEGKLKTAVLGLDEPGRLLLEAASKIDHFHIQAVADSDTRLAEKLAAQYNCTAYDDYRQLIIQNQLDCLLVAAAMYTCEKHIRSAIKKKFNILKLAPPARNFQEAVEFVRLAEDEDVKFAVANPTRFADSFLALREFLQQNQIEHIFLATAFCNVAHYSQPAWQSDPQLAGGGVLLRNCYHILDQITCILPTPQQVYSLNTSTAGDRQQRLYLTEDTTIVTMKFADNSFGNLIASKSFGPSEEFIKLYCGDKILTVSDTQFTAADSQGRLIHDLQYHDDEISRTTKLLSNFALSILSPDENKLCSSAAENLKNMAVIESAYLSARTGFAEQPERILKMAHVEPTNIWPDQQK